MSKKRVATTKCDSPSREYQLAVAVSRARGAEPWPVDCQRCGQCCCGLILELSHDDIAREPALLNHAKLLDGQGTLPPEQWVWAVPAPCPFLACTDEGRMACRIYNTRPEVCAAFVPGGQQCRQAQERGR